MKLVSTAPNRRLQAKDGTVYQFNADGLCVLPDDIALALPKTIYSIVKALNRQEAASLSSSLNAEVTKATPSPEAEKPKVEEGGNGDDTLSENEKTKASPEVESLVEKADASSESGTSAAPSASDTAQHQKRGRRRNQ